MIVSQCNLVRPLRLDIKTTWQPHIQRSKWADRVRDEMDVLYVARISHLQRRSLADKIIEGHAWLCLEKSTVTFAGFVEKRINWKTLLIKNKLKCLSQIRP